ncbi:MAG: LysR substrate-binding domain-containing protein [Marinomonas sp.]
MRRYLPSSTALKCFEASVRHLSFTRAAQELHLTQSAVSRQIRNLEEFLSRDLFIRLNKRLVLTGTGAAYYKEVVPLLDSMESACLKMLHREDEKISLQLASLPTLASFWLVPKLANFQRAHPQFNIKVNAMDVTDNLDPKQVDVILHYGGDHWPKGVSHHLMNEYVIPVCSPALLAEKGLTVNTAKRSDISHFPLMHLTSRSNAWSEWMAQQELAASHLTGPGFEHFHMLLEAAKSGMGVAIMPTMIVKEALASGALVAPFGEACMTPHEYFLSYPANKADLEQVVTFRDWLLEQVDPQTQVEPLVVG